ncbi:MAG: PQQ-binding-like beta-propeller repeat protein [Planctomycetaceae bacterium]|nr:PQQ-binding-like beta-propeller repeat protein [Planctomycetaceae bacterium]
MNRIPVFVAALMLTFIPSQSTRGTEWSRFRGPNGTGVGSGDSIPTEWTEKDYCFRAELPGGSGCSSPVVWGKKVFLLSADPEKATRYVVCIDGISGEKLWVRDYPSTAHHLHTRNTFASCTPAVDEERVYVAWSTPEETTFKALTHDGDEVWSLNLGRWQSQHGFGTSPVVYRDMVILHNSQQASQLKEGEQPGDSRMTAYDRRTGKELWSTPLTSVNVCYSVPFIYTPADGGPDEIVCTCTGNGMFSLNPENGQLNWSVNDDKGLFAMRTVNSPIAAGGHIFGSNGSGAYSGNYIVAVKPGKDAQLAFKLQNSSKFKAPYVPSLIADGDLLFCLYDRGFASAIDARSGEIYFIERTGADFSGSPVRAGNRIFAVDEKGVVWVFQSGKEYRVLAKNDLGEESRSTPAIANDRMYVRTTGHLFCIGAK